MASTVFWPTFLGLLYLVAGIVAWRREVRATQAADGFGVSAYGPAFVAAALAAFAGEHFSAAASLATIVPKWMPAPLSITYFVGVAHLAAATSYVARRYLRWSTIGLAVMFGSFVLLMDLPGAMARPSPLSWMLAARQASFAVGALALYATVGRGSSPQSSQALAAIARIWTALVLIAYGAQHLVHPEFAPGVPSPVRTAAWVPAPAALAFGTGLLLIGSGVMMFRRKHAGAAAACGGLLMLSLTLVLYVPEFFLAGTVGDRVTAINFIFDTLLFAGTLLVISRAVSGEAPVPSRLPVPQPYPTESQ